MAADVFTADGAFSPVMRQALAQWLRPLLGEAMNRAERDNIIVPPIFTTGTVKSVDLQHGTANVLCDHDLAAKAETDAAPVTADLVGGCTPVPGDRVLVVFADGSHLCLGHIGASGTVALAGLLYVGVAPSGGSSTAYLGNINRWNALEWSIGMTDDGRLIFNHKNGGGFTEFREENGSGGTLAWLHGRMSGGLAEITIPQYLPTVSGTGLVISTTGSHQVGLAPGSTARIKTDLTVVPAGDALALVDQFRLLIYRYRNSLPGIEDEATREALAQPHYGLTAEEVHAICPELVHLDRDGVPVALKYEQINMLTLGAVRDLLAENRALEARVAALDERLAKVEAIMAKHGWK